MVASLFSLIKFNCSNLNLAHPDSSSAASFRIHNDGISISKGITASIPYTKEHRVAFVEVLIVVRCA
jgi:hypothetical protein